MHEQSPMGAAVITIPSLRDSTGPRTLGLAMVMAALLHVGFAFYMSRPHTMGSSTASGGVAVDMENVKFQDQNTAPEGPTDMSYRPEVANVLPDAGGGGPAVGGPADMSQAKMDDAALDLSASGEGGEVLKIGGEQKSLDDLLAGHVVGGSGTGKPGTGFSYSPAPIWRGSRRSSSRSSGSTARTSASGTWRGSLKRGATQVPPARAGAITM